MIDIDYLWVGEHEKTGDAIACQFTDPASGANVVLVIDAGRRDDGTRVADHIRKYYGVNRVDLAVCTHPDDDHIQGLFTLFESIPVSNLLIHRPEAYGYTSDDVKAGLVDELIAVATGAGTTVLHKFAGTTFFGGALLSAGPTEAYYRQLLREQAVEVSLAASIAKALARAATKVSNAIRSIGHDPGETLTSDNGGTTERNNSSIILDLRVDGYRALFSGDAGVPALNAAADAIDALQPTKPVDFFHFPHHGSRHNLDPATLDRLLGPINSNYEIGSCFVSVGTEADDFPRPEVTNAIRRRGYPVRATRGQNIRWNKGGAERPDYSPIQAIDWLAE